MAESISKDSIDIVDELRELAQQKALPADWDFPIEDRRTVPASTFMIPNSVGEKALAAYKEEFGLNDPMRVSDLDQHYPEWRTEVENILRPQPTLAQAVDIGPLTDEEVDDLLEVAFAPEPARSPPAVPADEKEALFRLEEEMLSLIDEMGKKPWAVDALQANEADDNRLKAISDNIAEWRDVYKTDQSVAVVSLMKSSFGGAVELLRKYTDLPEPAAAAPLPAGDPRVNAATFLEELASDNFATALKEKNVEFRELVDDITSQHKLLTKQESPIPSTLADLDAMVRDARDILQEYEWRSTSKNLSGSAPSPRIIPRPHQPALPAPKVDAVRYSSGLDEKKDLLRFLKIPHNVLDAVGLQDINEFYKLKEMNDLIDGCLKEDDAVEKLFRDRGFRMAADDLLAVRKNKDLDLADPGQRQEVQLDLLVMAFLGRGAPHRPVEPAPQPGELPAMDAEDLGAVTLVDLPAMDAEDLGTPTLVDLPPMGADDLGVVPGTGQDRPATQAEIDDMEEFFEVIWQGRLYSPEIEAVYGGYTGKTGKITENITKQIIDETIAAALTHVKVLREDGKWVLPFIQPDNMGAGATSPVPPEEEPLKKLEALKAMIENDEDVRDDFKQDKELYKKIYDITNPFSDSYGMHSRAVINAVIHLAEHYAERARYNLASPEEVADRDALVDYVERNFDCSHAVNTDLHYAIRVLPANPTQKQVQKTLREIPRFAPVERKADGTWGMREKRILSPQPVNAETLRPFVKPPCGPENALPPWGQRDIYDENPGLLGDTKSNFSIGAANLSKKPFRSLLQFITFRGKRAPDASDTKDTAVKPVDSKKKKPLMRLNLLTGHEGNEEHPKKGWFSFLRRNKDPLQYDTSRIPVPAPVVPVAPIQPARDFANAVKALNARIDRVVKDDALMNGLDNFNRLMINASVENLKTSADFTELRELKKRCVSDRKEIVSRLATAGRRERKKLNVALNEVATIQADVEGNMIAYLESTAATIEQNAGLDGPA